MKMVCKICGSNSNKIEYCGKIRNGAVGNYTEEDVNIYKCQECGTLWHTQREDYEEYYESEKYRKDMEGTSNITDFYYMHDSENMDKFKITGVSCFRNKVVADIGCGGGSFLDFINTVAKSIIAIEPSEIYRKEMVKKGYDCFGYTSDALKKYSNGVDTVVSFDVIEHVADPVAFLGEIKELLKPGGVAYIGTPTDAPVMRELLGIEYESFLFSTQHPWVFCEESFRIMAQKNSVNSFDFMYYQRYGLGNCLYWLLEKKPGKNVSYDFISKALDEHWKAELEKQKRADYIVFVLKK